MERETSVEPMEYVLGLMDPQERRAFELALLDDPDLAAEVWQAEEDFAPLQGALKPRVPPPRVKRALDKRLFPSEAAPAQRQRGTPVGMAFWRGVASFLGLTSAVAAAVIAILIVRPDVLVPQQAPLVAAIQDDRGTVTLARVRADGTLVAEAYEGVLPEGRDPELWIIHEGADPLSLGVLSTERSTVLPLDVAMAGGPLDTARLVVTEEPIGGSPSGDPTGDAIAQGPLRQI